MIHYGNGAFRSGKLTPPPKPSLWENIQYWYSVVWEYIDPFLKIIWSFLKKLYVVFLVIFNVYVWFYFWPEYYLWSPDGKPSVKNAHCYTQCGQNEFCLSNCLER